MPELSDRLELSEDSKVFIFAPSNVVTGGQECLHQLCDALNNRGIQSYMVYYPDPASPIPPVYLKYNLRRAVNVEDCGLNVVVLFEGEFDRLFDYKKVKYVLWWLSVDNFFMCSMRYLSLRDYFRFRKRLLGKAFLTKVFHLLVRKRNVISKSMTLYDLRASASAHLCQSKYVEVFLSNESFGNLLPLYDYINSEFNSEIEGKREDIVLYNPKKGYKLTKTFIRNWPEFNWVPIANMNYQQIATLMRKSKLYVDFGDHPGRDKIPREAAMSGLCVITGKRGSAKYFEDVPIDDEYKFDESNLDLERLYHTIRDILDNYEVHRLRFVGYRDMVNNSRQLFLAQVDDFVVRVLK